MIKTLIIVGLIMLIVGLICLCVDASGLAFFLGVIGAYIFSGGMVFKEKEK